jgi:hypothetical protein
LSSASSTPRAPRFALGRRYFCVISVLASSFGACSADPDVPSAPSGGDASADEASRGDAHPDSADDRAFDQSAMPGSDASPDAPLKTDVDDATSAQPCLPGDEGWIPPPGTCSPDLPTDTDCPDATPSYSREVAGLIAQHCTVCHRPGGLETVHLFDTYAKIQSNMNQLHMLTQIYGCQMPPACAEPLVGQERDKMLKWLVCGSPNN